MIVTNEVSSSAVIQRKLQIVETTNFSILKHLSLNIQEYTSDEDVKNHMAHRIKHLEAYLPIRTSGPPQQGFGYTTNNTSKGTSGPAGIGAISERMTALGIGEDGEQSEESPSTGEARGGDKTYEASSPSTGVEEARGGGKTDEASHKDVRPSNIVKKQGLFSGRIFRREQPVSSAYFNNAGKK